MSPRRARAVIDSAAEPGAALRAHRINTTQDLIAGGGSGGLTTRRIAQRAGVSDGVLYNYFRDKDEVILAALDELFGTTVQRFLALLPEPGNGDIGANLAGLSRNCLALQQQLIPVVTVLISQPVLLTQFIDHIHDRPDDGPQQIIEGISDYIRAERARGRAAPATDPDAVATLLFGATMMEAFAGPLGRADPAHFSKVVQFITTGLTAGTR